MSLETSFLADEGASLPKMTLKHSVAIPERTAADNAISLIPLTDCHASAGTSAQDEGPLGLMPERVESESLIHLDSSNIPSLFLGSEDCRFENALSGACNDNPESNVGLDSFAISEFEDQKTLMVPSSGIKNLSQPELKDIIAQEEVQPMETHESAKPEKIDEGGVSSEYFSATDTNQSILVSFSSRCVLKGTVCERSRLLRIKFYGSFDKPLGRYLRDDLFDQVIHYEFLLPLVCCSLLCI